MSKNITPKRTSTDSSKYYNSTFTLTFAVEILGIDVWHDCSEGWLDLGPCDQGIKIQYNLSPGQNYEVNILIWPHAVKIWCDMNSGWVRTWQFLERRWLTFSIRHAFPVRVSDFRSFLATVTPTLGLGSLSANAKNDKTAEVYLPAMKFGERRYFAPVIEAEEDIETCIGTLIWNAVVEYIPPSYMDGLFDVPHPVSDIRHQDTVLHHVRESILNRNVSEEKLESITEPEEPSKFKGDRKELIVPKEKEKKKPEAAKVKFEINLPGDTILAGVGRIVSFRKLGDAPSGLGEIIVLISSNNLPAQDDQPIIFVNVENLFQVPVIEFKKLGILQVYTRWKLGDEVHDSETKEIKSKDLIVIDDHHVIPLPNYSAAEVISAFLDDPFEVQLRGIRAPILGERPKFFGYEKGDRDFGLAVPPEVKKIDKDFLIAVTRIEARSLAKGISDLVRGEYPLFPPIVQTVNLAREAICTNDINAIRAKVTPELVVRPHVILESQMSLEVSVGLVGCRPRRLISCFSRLYALIKDSNSIMNMLREISEINEKLVKSGKRNEVLTGFALDTGDVVVLFIEGPRDGQILQVWELTDDLYAYVKPIFSSSLRYSTRIYSELLLASMPFSVMKMYVPLSILLACPPIYARPAMPLPTRSVLMKLGRLVARKGSSIPCRFQLPSTAELNSFKLELCVAPRPIPLQIQVDSSLNKMVSPQAMSSLPSASRINWDNEKKNVPTKTY